MNLVKIIVHFEFADRIEAILDNQGIENYIRIPRVESRDREGKHFGSKVYPGSSTLMEAQVDEQSLPGLLEELQEFKGERDVHTHMQILVLRVEQSL